MFKKLKIIISKYRIFIILAAVIPILGFILFFRQAIPPRVSPPKPIFDSLPLPETQFGILVKPGITYQFSFPQNAFAQFPNQLSVYQIKKLSNEEVLARFSAIALELGFSSSPTIQTSGDFTFYVWEESDKFLKVNSQTGQFIFKGESPITLGPVTPQEAEALVEEKLANWELLPKDALTSINYFGIAGMELEPITNPNLADVYEIVFSSSIDSYPIIGFGPAQDVALARVTKEGQLITFNYFFHQFDREKVGVYPLKSSEEIISQIQQGQGKILSLKTKEGRETNLNPENPIKTINLGSVNLAYYETVEKQEYLQPIYLFLGGVTLEDGQVLEVSLYLPAVSSEWLAPPTSTPASRFKIE